MKMERGIRIGVLLFIALIPLHYVEGRYGRFGHWSLTRIFVESAVTSIFIVIIWHFWLLFKEKRKAGKAANNS